MDIQLLLLLLGITALFVIFLPLSISILMGIIGVCIFSTLVLYRLFCIYVESDISNSSVVKG